MTWFGRLLATAICVALCVVPVGVLAQAQSKSVFLHLDEPTYPRLAQVARITGSMSIEVGIQSDGSVASVQVLSGSPMLRAAALRSAQNSRFKCHHCSQAGASLSVTYTFSLREIKCGLTRIRSAKCIYVWKCGYRSPHSVPRSTMVRRSGNQITVVADSVCIEPSSGRSLSASQ
jgi:TonB family protein